MTVVILHGLEGSSQSQYVVGNARKLWAAGMNVVRMNMRNCGGTEALTPTLYHSGLSSDVEAVLAYFTQLYLLKHTALVGYSMGGNLVLKLAGELGSASPPSLRAVVGVSPPWTLVRLQVHCIMGSTVFMNAVFCRLWSNDFVAKLGCFRESMTLPGRKGLPPCAPLMTGSQPCTPASAMREDYYFRASAARVLGGITVPTLILHAADDPFVRLMPESRAAIAANPAITLIEPEHGGHCAFLANPDRRTGDDGYWAESTLLHFLQTWEEHEGLDADTLQ